MTEVSEQQVRRLILAVLYQARQENKPPVSRKEMLKILGVPETQLDNNLFYLESKGLVTKAPPNVQISLFWYASISP